LTPSQAIATSARTPSSVAPEVVSRSRSVVLLDGDAVAIEDDGLGPQAVDRCPQQDHVQAAAVDAHLGKRVAGVTAAVLAVDELAEPVEERALPDRHARAGELVLETQSGELPHGMGQERDADAELPELRGAFEHAAPHSVLIEIEGERQAGDAAADDRNVHWFWGLPAPGRAGSATP
jgi:hypothetical protein